MHDLATTATVLVKNVDVQLNIGMLFHFNYDNVDDDEGNAMISTSQLSICEQTIWILNVSFSQLSGEE